MAKLLTKTPGESPIEMARRRREVGLFTCFMSKYGTLETLFRILPTFPNLSHVAQIRRYFDKADKNKDGKLTKEEWHRVLNSSGVPTTR